MRLLSIFLGIFLVGCSSYKDDFRCPVGEGYACHSMSYVHDQVSKEKLRDEGKADKKFEIYYPPQEKDVR